MRDDHGILGIGAAPSFAIGQRALLVKSRAGNVLWDCTPYLDDEIVARINAEGGLAAIAISHPHYYVVDGRMGQRLRLPDPPARGRAEVGDAARSRRVASGRARRRSSAAG